MNAKDKAKDIYEKYYNNLTDVLNNAEAKEFAVTCSYIYIDEIIKLGYNITVWRNVRYQISKI